MSITISNDYPTFKVTDNLHQLVDRLGILTDAVDSNFRVFDSSMNDVLTIVHRDSDLITSETNLNIVSPGSLNMRADSGSIRLISSWHAWVQSQGRMYVEGAPVELGSHIGEIRMTNQHPDRTHTTLATIKSVDRDGVKDVSGGGMQIDFASGPAVKFFADDAEFPGTITMPSSGTGSPYTEAKTVSGAINELHEELVQITEVELERIVDLETLTNQHTSTLSSHTTTLASHDTRIQVFEGLNISNRLTSIESRLDDIERRLGLLGV